MVHSYIVIIQMILMFILTVKNIHMKYIVSASNAKLYEVDCIFMFGDFADRIESFNSII